MTDWAPINLGLHALAALIWVGGSLALGPITLAARARPGEAGARISRIARRLGWLMWPALAVAIVTGVLNTELASPSSGSWFSAPTVDWLAAKVVAVGGMTLLAGLHSFVLGPRLRHRREAGVPESELAGLRRSNALLGLGATVASLIVLALGIVLGGM